MHKPWPWFKGWLYGIRGDRLLRIEAHASILVLLIDFQSVINYKKNSISKLMPRDSMKGEIKIKIGITVFFDDQEMIAERVAGIKNNGEGIEYREVNRRKLVSSRGFGMTFSADLPTREEVGQLVGGWIIEEKVQAP